MPRIAAHTDEEILDRALFHFWQHGYLKTSIDDLVEATGAPRYGLYRSFGSKHGLFIASLRRYQEIYIGHRLRELEKEAAGLDAIRLLISNLTVFTASSLGRFGCLLSNTAVELGGRDKASDREVERYTKRLRTALDRAIRTARSTGDLEAAADPDALADYLAGVVIGAFVYARTQARPGAVRAMLETAVAWLPVTA